MPISLMSDSQKKLAITTCSGLLTDEEVIEARKHALGDATLDPSFDRLWDFTEVTEIRVSDETIAQIVSGSPPAVGNICRAIVVSKAAGPLERIIHFISRSREVSRRIAAFPDRVSAEDWIENARRETPPA